MTWLAPLALVPLSLVLTAVLWTERGRLRRVGFHRFAIEFEAPSRQGIVALPGADCKGAANAQPHEDHRFCKPVKG